MPQPLKPVRPRAHAPQQEMLSQSKAHVPKPSSVQALSRVRLFATPWTAARQASLSIIQLPGFTQTHVHHVSDAIQPSSPLSFPSPPTFNLSQHQGLFQEVPKLERAHVLQQSPSRVKKYIYILSKKKVNGEFIVI